MQALGGFLIVVGFILGVYCGILLSSRKVIFLGSGEVNQSKLLKITLLAVVSAGIVWVGQFLFTIDTWHIYKYQP